MHTMTLKKERVHSGLIYIVWEMGRKPLFLTLLVNQNALGPEEREVQVNPTYVVPIRRELHEKIGLARE